jgi:Holliday junction resolvasome RuvABC endonuclease subunit
MSQITSSTSEKIILGIDPGTRFLGYGLIKINKELIELKQYLSNTILQMNNLLETTVILPKLLSFQNDVVKYRFILKQLLNQFDEVDKVYLEMVVEMV